MPRPRRYFLPEVPVHIVQRGDSKASTFLKPKDFQIYRQALIRACAKTGCHVHAYVLMTNHVHLLVTPPQEDSLPRFMKSIGVNYVPYFNREYERTGSIWEGRYKSSMILQLDYFASVMRYIELNPVRAGIVEKPIEYYWSSYAANAYGKEDRVVSPHPIYLNMGVGLEERLASYRGYFGGLGEAVYAKVISDAIRNDADLGDC